VATPGPCRTPEITVRNDAEPWVRPRLSLAVRVTVVDRMGRLERVTRRYHARPFR